MLFFESGAVRELDLPAKIKTLALKLIHSNTKTAGKLFGYSKIPALEIAYLLLNRAFLFAANYNPSEISNPPGIAEFYHQTVWFKNMIRIIKYQQ